MTRHYETDVLQAESGIHFRRMVESVGVKRFADVMSLSTRQINRMLAGAQPNPVERIIRCMQSCEADVGDGVLNFICQEAGGYFVKEEGDLDSAAVNAVKECAEAIAAISDGQVSRVAESEVREAICALTALLRTLSEHRAAGEGGAAANATPPAVSTRRMGATAMMDSAANRGG